MNKDLEQFENRSDDWLAKERHREDSISVWDIDEGKRIREYHEEHCEAKEIKENHKKAHDSYYQDITSKKTSQSDFKRLNDVNPIPLLIVIMVVIVPMLVISQLKANTLDLEGFLAAIFILFVIITVNKNKRRKNK